MRSVSSDRLPRSIPTRHLMLEAVEPRHADALWESTRSSLNELRPWLAWAMGASRDASRVFAFGAGEEWDRMVAWNFAIVVGGVPSGTVSLHNYIPVLQRAELGYWLRTDLTGRGLMTEAASAVVEFGFEQLKLHRIELHAGLDNHASARVAEKLGFVREGLLRDASRGAGGWYDVYVFGLLDGDPRPRLHL